MFELKLENGQSIKTDRADKLFDFYLRMATPLAPLKDDLRLAYLSNDPFIRIKRTKEKKAIVSKKSEGNTLSAIVEGLSPLAIREDKEAANVPGN